MPEHKEYRQKWIGAGYACRMGSAWVRLPPPPDLIALYYFTTAQYAKKAIEYSRLKVARFSDANDPFELLALNFRVHDVRHPVRNFKREQDTQTGMLCFSANWTRVTLWSHYAKNHSGVCLGFDVLRKNVDRVQYQDERIRGELDQSGEDPTKISPDLQKLLLCTKAREWEYEQEYRRLVKLSEMIKEGPLYFCPFDDANMKLAEVILGARCRLNLADVRDFTRANHHPDAVVFNARLAFGSFTVAPLEDTIP